MKYNPYRAANSSFATRRSPNFMKPEVLFPFSQQPLVRPYPEPDQFSPHPPTDLFNVHFNITLGVYLVFQVVSFLQLYALIIIIMT